MSTPKEQYDSMLDELDDETKMNMISHILFARVLEELDPVAYRCGQNDFKATCDKCGDEFWPDDPNEEAVCDDCRASEDEDEDDVIPPCAASMGCLCAAHAKGRAADGPCDTDESCDPDTW